MSANKRPSLTDFGRKGAAPPAPEAEAPAEERPAAPRAAAPRGRPPGGTGGSRKEAKLKDGRVGMYVYQTREAIHELKRLALEEECAVSDLVAEGINHVLQMHGRPPLARARPPRE